MVASAVTAVPWLAAVSRHKDLAFAVSGLLLAVNYWLVVIRPRRCAPGDVCHADSPRMRWNRRVFWVSSWMYASALLLTYGSLRLLSFM